VAQGAGQALLEEVVYDRDGQLLTGSLMDYSIPRADTLPPFTVDFSPVASPTNPLGAKGVGEGGAVAGTPTVMNAILDALALSGVTDLPMPATPQRIWRALRERRADRATSP
jgi:carbon-monoxide dehydrogenase large subunit